MTHKWGSIRGFLLPGAEDEDPSFRAELEVAGRRGLSYTGWVLVVLGLLAMATAGIDGMGVDHVRGFFYVLLGVCGIGVARHSRLRRHARQIGVAMMFVLALAIMFAALVYAREVPEVYHYVPGTVSLILIGVAAVLPVRPLAVLGLTLASGLAYLAISQGARAAGVLNAPPFDLAHGFHVLLNGLLATGIAGVMYRQRMSEYQSHESALRERCSALRSESGASLGRLAAALSHELNTPIGALTSSVDTLLRANRHALDDPERAQAIQADLARTIRESTERLVQVTSRMQQFANLDRAETQTVDLLGLVQNVAQLARANGPAGVVLRVEGSGPVPIVCKPQRVSSMLYSLLHRSIEQSPEGRCLRIQVRSTPEGAEMLFEDDRANLPTMTDGLFDFRFEADGQRIAACGWELFSARQIAEEHGGSISVEPFGPEGARMTMRLRSAAARPDAA